MISNRQSEVLRILLRDEKTTIKNIAQELEVNTRTIERHINNLTVEGVPITSKRGRHGGISIDRRYKLNRVLFTEKNIYELFIAISIYANIADTEHKKEMIEKLMLMNPEYIDNITKITEKYFEIDLFEKPITIKEEIKSILGNVFDKKCLVTLYGKQNKIDMLPISCVLKGNGLFLYGVNKEYMLIEAKEIKKIEIRDEKLDENLLVPYKKNKNARIVKLT